MPAWVKAISSSKCTLASPQSSNCTVLREPQCTSSCLPIEGAAAPQAGFAMCSIKTAHALCEIFKLHAEGQVFYRNELSQKNNRNSPSPPTEDSARRLASKCATPPAKLVWILSVTIRGVGKPGLKWLLPMISSSCKLRCVFFFKIINSQNGRESESLIFQKIEVSKWKLLFLARYKQKGGEN